MLRIIWIGLFLVGCSTGIPYEKRQAASNAYNQLAAGYVQLGRLQSAQIAYQKALQLQSNSADSYQGLALIFQQQDDFELAEQYFLKALSLAANSAQINNNYAAFLFDRGRYEQACSYLEVARRDYFYLQRAQLFENLGRCYLKLNKKQLSLARFHKALKLDKQRSVTLLELTGLYLQFQEVSKAIKYFAMFSELQEQGLVQHNAASLWLAIRLQRAAKNKKKLEFYAARLTEEFSDSREYKLYKRLGHEY